MTNLTNNIATSTSTSIKPRVMRFVEGFNNYEYPSMTVMATSQEDASKFISYINKTRMVYIELMKGSATVKYPIFVVARYTANFLEDVIQIAVEEALATTNVEYDMFNVYCTKGKWLSSSEL